MPKEGTIGTTLREVPKGVTGRGRRQEETGGDGRRGV